MEPMIRIDICRQVRTGLTHVNPAVYVNVYMCVERVRETYYSYIYIYIIF